MLKSLRAPQRRSHRTARFETLEARTLLAADMAPDQVLIQFNPKVSPQAEAAVYAAISGHVKEHIHTPAMIHAGAGDLDVVNLPPGYGIQKAIDRLQNNPAVRHAEPNWIFHTQMASNDPSYTNGSLWGMYGDASSPANQYGSQAAEVWAQGNTGSSSVAVGIVDEGIDYNHPDLAANIWTNPDEVPNDGIDNDGDGYVDDIHGWDFANNDNTIFDGTPSNNVDHHGTHVAGTIAAAGGNGQGVAGVTWSTKLISAKFLGPNGGYLSDAVKALDYLTTLKTIDGVNIVASNNSWGGGGFSSTLQSAITRAANAGILFIAAAGNGGNDGIGDNNDTVANYPSNYDTTSGAGYDSVVAVAAIDSSGRLASFSNYGATTVDLGAPGVNVLSTLPFNTYGYYSGTSMATPHVTGTVALYAASHPGATAASIRDAVLNAARNTPTSSLAGKTATGGRLNASAMGNPALSIADNSVSEGDSGTTNLTFTVTLSAASTQPVTVNYSTASGTAIADSDYQTASGSLTFNPNETSKQILVSVIGDTVAEADETFSVNLSSPVGATLSRAQASGTILNDDASPLPGVLVNNVTANEGQRGWTKFVFTVSLSAASAQTVTVPFSTADGTALAGSDYRATSGTLSFSPGVTSMNVTVQVSGDRTAEPNETFFLNVGAPGTTVATPPAAQGIGTITNDDGSAPAKAGVTSLAASGDTDSFLSNLYDVDGDGVVSPLDVLLLVNELNAHGPSDRAMDAVRGTPAAAHDISGDGQVTAVDALLVVNYLNAAAKKPAADMAALWPSPVSEAVDLLMADLSAEPEPAVVATL
jgi:subtilisin family serine protease